ncbi:MAG: M56 family metallopeptidase [Chloroflexota bacterium]|nr:M56 family metallopeptidase [Chloroflexota bacterium]
MHPDAWWRGLLTVGLATLASLSSAAFAPLLMRALPDGDSGHIDLVCLFLPTSSDWAAHWMSYAILLLLGAGAVSGCYSFGRQIRRTRRMLRQLLQFARPVDAALHTFLQTLHLADRLDLVQTTVPLAFCYGIRRPRICLSTGLIAVLDQDELTAVLWHEQAHLVQRDPFKVAFGRAWVAAFFFVPLAHGLYRQYLLAKEVAADAYACARQGSNGPLTGALAVLLEWQSAAQPPVAAGATELLETRVNWLLDQPAPLTIPLAPTVWTGLILVGIISVELALTQAGVANALWNLSHLALGNC